MLKYAKGENRTNEKMKGNQNGRIRYDDAFKQGAINMIVEQKMPLKKVSQELGVSTDSLRTWLRNANFNPVDKNSNNNLTKKVRDLEAQIKSLQKEISKKDEAIEILKKSIGIIYNP